MIANPAAIAADLRQEHRQHAGADGDDQQRPQPVEDRRARVRARAASAGAWRPRAGGDRVRRPRCASPCASRSASPHPPARSRRRSRCRSTCSARPITVSAASSVAEAALSSTVGFQEVAERISSSRARSSPRTPSGPSTSVSASSSSSGGRLVRAHADAHRVAEPAALLELGQPAEGVEVGDVVADVDGGGEVGLAEQRRRCRRPCRSAPAGGSRAPCGPSG